MIRLHLILLTMVAGLSAFDSRGAERPQHNFLFIVDSSSSMSPRKPAAIKLLRDVIESRFEQQIEAGDSIDIWTYDTEKNLNGFPPQIWQRTNAVRIAESAAQYLEKYPFEGRRDFGSVAVDLNLLIPQTKALLVLVITDGESPFSGFNLDLDINGFLAKKGKLGPDKDPFLISLAAINGSMRTWTAHFGEGQPDLATLPERTKPKAKVAEAKAKPIIKPQSPAPKPFIAAASPLVLTPNNDFIFNFPSGTRINPDSVSEQDLLQKPLEVPKTEPKTPAAQYVGTAVTTTNAAAKAETPSPAKLTISDETNAAIATVPQRATNMASAVPKTNLANTQLRTNFGKSLHFGKVAPTNTNTIAMLASTNSLSNAVAVAASVTNHPQPAATVTVKTSKPNSSSPSGGLNTHQTFRRAILVSGLAGVGCVVLGVYLLYRKLRRPTESIISRSLLQR